MNEEPKSVWRRPWEGRRKVFGWFLMLTAATFVILLALTLVTGLVPASAAALTSLVISVVVAGAMVLAILFGRWVMCWRNFKRLLFGIASFVTLIALFYAVENWRGKRAWEKHRAELLAKGETLSIVELAPPPIPDEQNFAMTRLLKPVMDFTQTSTNVIWHDTNGSARLQAIDGQLSMRSSEKGIKLGFVQEEALADLSAWQEFYLGNTNYPQPAAPGEPAKDILFALSKFDPEISELIQAAKERPLTRFPITYEHEPAYGILLPHLSYSKQLTSLINIRTTASLEAGQSDRAFEELMLGFRLSDSISKEPILISHLVRIATLAINSQALREGLARHAWSEGQLREMQKQLASIDLLAEYGLAVRGGRALCVGSLDYIRSHGVSGLMELAGDDLAPERLLHIMPNGWYFQNMLTILEMHEQFALPIVHEQAHRVFPEIAAQWDEATLEVKEEFYHPYNMLAAMFVPSLSKAVAKSGRLQTIVDAAQVACALERYRLENAALPDELSALTPQFISSIPTDVIDGEPLRYRKTGEDSYIIYSVGWNQTDEGGEVGWTNDRETSVDIYKGDWVWFHEGQ